MDDGQSLSNLKYMAKSPLILAALAKDAVPHVNFTQVNSLSSGVGGAFDTALLTATDGKHYIVRVANTQAAGADQEVELRAFKALNANHRSQLPFEVSNVIGETRDLKGHRALILDYVYGNPIDANSIAPDSQFSMSIGRAIAAIHNLDRAVVSDAHLTEYDSAEIVRTRTAELDRIAATGKVPAVLLERWETALEDMSIFKFQTTVIHDALSGDTVLGLDQAVSGVLSWSGLKIGDPAEDFAWLAETGNHELLESVLKTYSATRSAADASIAQRATLYSELEKGRWLLHGVTKGNQDIIDDAIGMLAELAEDVSTGVIGRLNGAAPAAAAAVIEISQTVAPASFAEPVQAFVETEQTFVEIEQTIVIDESEDSDAEPFEVSVHTEAIEIIEIEETIAAPAVDDKTRPIELPDKGENELF